MTISERNIVYKNLKGINLYYLKIFSIMFKQTLLVNLVLLTIVVMSVNAILKVPNQHFVAELENSIIHQFKLLPTIEIRTQIINKLLGVPDVEVIVLAENQSIRIYFLITTLEALLALRAVFDNGQLKTKIESVFSYLITEVEQYPICVTHLDMLDFVKSQMCFTNGKFS